MERRPNVGPLIEVFAVLVEDLDPAVGPIRHVDASPIVNGNGVNEVKLARSRARFSPRHKILPILVELYDSRVDVAIGDENPSIRKPRDIRESTEVLVVLALHETLAERHDEFLPIMRELEDLMQIVVNNPNVLFGIVRTDLDLVWPASAFPHLVPLSPGLRDLSGRVDDQNGMLPA